MTLWRYPHHLFKSTVSVRHLNQSISSMLAPQYVKYWQVHCAKPHKNTKKDIEYLGRSTKRPAIANSRLVHYNGSSLLFKLLNHRTKKINTLSCIL